MDKTNFNKDLLRIINLSRELVVSGSHEYLSVEHFLKCLIDDKGPLAKSIEALGDLNKIEFTINNNLKKIKRLREPVNKVYWDSLFEKILQSATNSESILAQAGGTPVINTKDVVLSIIKNEKTNHILNISYKGFKLMADGNPNPNEISSQDLSELDAVNRFTVDLTASAASGTLDPVIGRDDEIKRMVQILCRRSKNNPLLIGESGVGKTAIVNALAQKIVDNDVPEILKNKKVLSLNLGALIAGTKFRGELEERVNSLLKEIKDNDNIILFIDELHNLVSTGKSDGGTDISEMLKPALANGELHCLGIATLDKYSKNIEKDTTLARRFQTIFISEPSIDDSIAILRGLKEKFEIYHGIKITDKAIVSSVKLSKRYITDRFLPDKAIDLIDETTSFVRIQIDSKPDAINNIEKNIFQLKLEKDSLNKEFNEFSDDKLLLINNKIDSLSKEADILNLEWKTNKSNLLKIKTLKEKISNYKVKSSELEKTGDLEKASEIRFGIIPELNHQLDDMNKNIINNFDEFISEEHISETISKLTGIPISKLDDEKDKLLNIERILTERVIGQEVPVKAIAQAIKRSRAGLQDPNKPLGSFMFLGSSGVGKTELCKTLADFLFDDETAIVRMDMSEFGEKHMVSRLIGAPPGYAGYEEGGALTEAVRQRPYQIVLFDEIEKAHPDIFNILLQVLDDGRLTDGQGKVVDFKNTIIIMTSNLGSRYIEVNSPPDEYKPKVMEVVKNHFRPEFLNRIDEILIFEHLSVANIKKIITLQLNNINSYLKEKNITISLTKESYDWLAEEGYDPTYGVRPLKRLMQQSLQNPLSDEFLKEKIKNGNKILASLNGPEFKYQLLNE